MAHGVFFEDRIIGGARIRVQTIDVIGVTAPVPAGATGFAIGDSKMLQIAQDIVDLGLPAGDLSRQLDAIRSNFGGPIILNGTDPGVDQAAAITNLTGSAATKTGVHSHQDDRANHGVSPTWVIAPGYSDAGLHSALIANAQKIKAMAVLDGPDTDTASAIAAADALGDPEGRAWFVDPWCTLGGETIAPSAYLAGVGANTEYWRSPSNKVILGLDGTTRAINFELTDDSDEAQILNNAQVVTIVRDQGFRTWGNQNLATSGFQMPFISDVRSDDRIQDAMAQAHKFWVDSGLTKTFAENLVDSANDFLSRQSAAGRLIGAEAFLNPEVNTEASLANGDLFVDYDVTFIPPARNITFRRAVTNRFLATIVAG